MLNPTEYVSYAAIGTSATPATLTAAYAANRKVFKGRHLPNITLQGIYTPAETNSTLLLLVEKSIDDGATFQPLTVSVPSATVTDVYAEGISATDGIPFRVPGDVTSTAATAIPFTFELTVLADHIRVSAMEVTSDTFGTAYVQIALAGT